MRKLILPVIALLLFACAAPTSWTSPVFEETPTEFPTIFAPTQTATSTTVPTATPIPFDPYVYRSNNLVADPADYRAVLANYYLESPDSFRGYTTRYGSESLIEEVMWRHVQEMLDQVEHTSGFTYLGGWSGYVDFSGEEFLMNSRGTDAWTKVVSGERPDDWKLTPNQRDLLTTLDANGIDKSDDKKQAFFDIVRYDFDYIIATKSPNDFGKMYCARSGTPPYEYLGRVIVGDFAAQHDWTPYYPSDGTESHVHLGQRVLLDQAGEEWYWAADIPDELYYRILGDNSALIILEAFGIFDGQTLPC